MKKNTIKMPYNYKSMFTLKDMEAIRDFIKNNEDCVITDAVRALENALNGEALKSSADWALNTNANNRLGSSSLDIFITTYILHYGETGEEIEYIGIYLTDIWDLNGYNWDEIQSRAYIRHFITKQ